MAFNEDFPEWFRRRRRSPFFGSLFEEIDRMFQEMEEELRALTSNVPRDYVRERKLPDGSLIREFGPFVYGYSIKIGPDGKPEIREFGNVKPSRFGPQVKEEREPLVDIAESDNEVQVVAELPGVEKEDIKVYGTEDTLTISVDTPQRKYYKEITLPAKVDVKKAKTQYKNGVLEIKLPKTEEAKKPKGEELKIE